MGDILHLRLNIDGKPIVNKYCEGKMKRTLKRGLKDLKSLRRKVRKLANAGDALQKRSWRVSSKGPEGLAEEEPLPVEDKIMFGLLKGALIFRVRPKLRTYTLASMRSFCDLVETAFLQPS